MKRQYDFSNGKRGRIVPEPVSEKGKIKVSIRLDEDIIDYFNEIADKSGGKAGYQTLINSALREYMSGHLPQIEDTLRRILREELKKVG